HRRGRLVEKEQLKRRPGHGSSRGILEDNSRRSGINDRFISCLGLSRVCVTEGDRSVIRNLVMLPRCAIDCKPEGLTSATGTAWERTPWRAIQRAACEAKQKGWTDAEDRLQRRIGAVARAPHDKLWRYNLSRSNSQAAKHRG